MSTASRTKITISPFLNTWVSFRTSHPCGFSSTSIPSSPIKSSLYLLPTISPTTLLRTTPALDIPNDRGPSGIISNNEDQASLLSHRAPAQLSNTQPAPSQPLSITTATTPLFHDENLFWHVHRRNTYREPCDNILPPRTQSKYRW